MKKGIVLLVCLALIGIGAGDALAKEPKVEITSIHPSFGNFTPTSGFKVTGSVYSKEDIEKVTVDLCYQKKVSNDGMEKYIKNCVLDNKEAALDKDSNNWIVEVDKENLIPGESAEIVVKALDKKGKSSLPGTRYIIIKKDWVDGKVSPFEDSNEITKKSGELTNNYLDKILSDNKK